MSGLRISIELIINNYQQHTLLTVPRNVFFFYQVPVRSPGGTQSEISMSEIKTNRENLASAIRETTSPDRQNTYPDTYKTLNILPTWAFKWQIKWKDLIVEDTILGEGNFGKVRAGEVKVRGRVTKAAVKMLKGKSSTNVIV